MWFRPGEEMWRNSSGASGGDEFQGMYIHGTTDHPYLEDFRDTCDWQAQPMSESGLGHDGSRGWSKDEVSMVGGEAALPIRREVPGSGGRPFVDVILVAVGGEPYALRYTLTEEKPNGEGGVMTADYDDIGEPVDPPEPPTDVVIEVEELGDENPFADL